MNIFEETPGVVDTDWYMEDRQTRINLVVDKEKAALHGISASISGTGMFLVIPRIFLGLLNFFLECFIRPANFVSLKGKTEKSDLIRRCNTAFILIEFESALKKSPDTAHHSFTRTLTFHQNDGVRFPRATHLIVTGKSKRVLEEKVKPAQEAAHHAIKRGSPRLHSKGGNDNQKTRQRPDTGHD
ncbi:MAG: hypothetical protein JRI33_04030 [Deltaproteobacteria bacterium]|nr:hypothetical protein [Deltaproteobacteria bacterium]MBW1967295.1 hypothetical protein [Deltaproteobacteria bacterium]